MSVYKLPPVVVRAGQERGTEADCEGTGWGPGGSAWPHHHGVLRGPGQPAIHFSNCTS